MINHIIDKRLKELCPKGYLENKQNINLFKEYQNDKLNNIPLDDSQARTLLILGNKRLVYYVLKKEFGICGDFKSYDETSVAYIGLIRAVDTYKLEPGTTFATYSYKVIKNEVLMYYRKLNSKSNGGGETKIFLEDDIPDKDEKREKLHIFDVISDDSNFIDDVIDKETVKLILKNLKYLTYNEAFSIIYYFGLYGQKAKTQQEIGDKLGVVRSLASRYCTRGIKKLKVLSICEDSLNDEDKMLRELLLKQGVQNDIWSKFQGQNY